MNDFKVGDIVIFIDKDTPELTNEKGKIINISRNKYYIMNDIIYCCFFNKKVKHFSGNGYFSYRFKKIIGSDSDKICRNKK